MNDDDRKYLALSVRSAWAALDGGAGLDATPVRWSDVRFIGEFGGHVVDGPTSSPTIEWQRAALRALRSGDLPRACLPVKYRGETWRGVHPDRIDWTGYRHAGGDPSRRARSGPSGPTTPERERPRKQFLLRVTDDERELIESTRREGETSSAAVVRLAREEIDRGKPKDS